MSNQDPQQTTPAASPAEPDTAATVRLTAGDTEVTLAPDNGCRVAGLRVAGTELLRQGQKYGCFPMVPWCGRIAEGQFRTGGHVHRMPLNSPPHAIHGNGRDLRWRTALAEDRAAVFTYALDDPAKPWPYPGTVTQRVELAEDGGSLTLTLCVEAASDSFPAQAGWHPWFRRHLDGDEDAPRAREDGVRIDFAPAWQEERGADHLPTGKRVDPRPGPWDDCFGMPDGVDVTLTWPGRLELKVASRAEWVVLFDEQDAAVCVEPQTGPPNGLNDARLVTPIDPLEVSTTWTWRTLS